MWLWTCRLPVSEGVRFGCPEPLITALNCSDIDIPSSLDHDSEYLRGSHVKIGITDQRNTARLRQVTLISERWSSASFQGFATESIAGV